MIANAQFERGVLRRLTGLAKRLRWYGLTVGAGVVMLYLLVSMVLQLLLDYALRLPLDMRTALTLVIAAGLIVVGWKRVFRPLRYPFGAPEMAHLIEQRNPSLKSILVSAVQFAGGKVGDEDSNSPELMRLVIDRACNASASVPFEAVLEHGRARRGLMSVVAVIAVGVGAFALRPEVMGIWFERNVLLKETPWPQRTHLQVELPQGVLTGARGDDLPIHARADGDVPREVSIISEMPDGTLKRETMIAVGQRGFRHTFMRADEEFRFRLEGGDDRTEWFETRLADRPAVESVAIDVTPPGYTGLEPYTVPQGQRAVETLRGSEITFAVRLNKPSTQTELYSGQDLIGPAAGEGDAWSITVAPETSRTYHFALRDELGLENKRPVRMSVRILKDAPPRVRVDVPGVSDIVTAEAVLRIDLSCSDLYGLSRAEVLYQIEREDAAEEILPTPDFRPGMTQYDAALRFDLSPLTLIPGERITIRAEAADFDDVAGPNESESGALTLRVVTNEELLAELARREQEYRQEFERVVEQQEDLRRQLLTLIGNLGGEAYRQQITTHVAPLERRQRQIAGQVNLIRQQFEQILAEFQVNGLDSSAVRERLDDGVVQPLNQLGRRTLVLAADQLRRIERDPTAETAGIADDSQEASLDAMRRILANMLKWEGYQEAVTMLREIVRLQKELHEETREEIDRRATDLLGGG